MSPSNLSGLAGKRIALTRPAGQAGDFSRVVQLHGGIPLVRPVIEIEAVESGLLDRILSARITYDWTVFTSANAVSAFCAVLQSRGIELDNRVLGRIAAVGPSTAARVKECLRAPDLVSVGQSAESLAREMGAVMNARVLFPRGELAMADLPLSLKARGATLDSPVLYRTMPTESAAILAREWESELVDAVLFSSPSAVRFVRAAMDPEKLDSHAVRKVAVFCLGESTASEARASGFAVAAIAERHTQEGLLETAAQWFDDHERIRRGH